MQLLRYTKYIALVGFIFFVSVFWYLYVEETSWGFNRLPSWRIYLISIGIFFPWEFFWGLRKSQAFLSIGNKTSKIKQDFLSAKEGITPKLRDTDFLKRLRNATIALILFMVFAEEYIVREFSTIPRIRTILRSAWFGIQNYVVNITNYPIIINNTRSTYEIRGFIFYIIGLIILRQGIRYIFLPTIKKYESFFLQKLDELYNQPSKTKLAAYTLLASIVLVFITFILNQVSNSLIVDSPFEAKKQPSKVIFVQEVDPLLLSITIDDFNLTSSNISGSLSITEYQHVYKKGECEDIYTTECDLWECNDIFSETVCKEDTGFPPVLFGQENIAINGKVIPVLLKNDIAVATDTDFTSQVSGNNYIFPFNTYTAIIKVSPDNFWNYSKVKISTNHRFFSISQDQSQNTAYPYGDTFYFKLGYAPYYKILVIVIFSALIYFLWLMWQTDERETLIELSVGVFAAIITIRNFLIPQEFSTDPIFLDQVLLIYIAIFMFVLVYKYEAVKEKKRA